MTAKGVRLVAGSLALHEAVNQQLKVTIHDRKNAGWDVVLLFYMVNDAWSRGLFNSINSINDMLFGRWSSGCSAQPPPS